MKASNIIFLIILLFVPTLAHADIFAQFSYNPGGCTAGSGFNLDCSTDYSEGLFSAISCKVLGAFNKGAIPMYCSIVTSAEYLSAIHATMALFVIIWGISFIIGTVPTTTGSAMVNLLKMSFIYFFATNASIFFDFFYVTILAVPAEIVGIVMQAQPDGAEDFFSHVDKHFTKIFEEIVKPDLQDGSTVQKVDVRLFVLGIAVGKLVPGGAFITMLFYAVISGWMIAYINIMVRYLLAIMGLIFLLMLAPIFLPAKLFKAMEFLTDEWQKMIVSFIVQIVIVVLFLIMVEPFFVDFLDLIKLGFNEIVLERGYNEILVSQGKTAVGDTVEAIYESTGVTMASAEKYVTQIQSPVPADEFVPWFVFKLLAATVVIYITHKFIKEVPTFAVLVSGNAKFNRVMQAHTDTTFGTGKKSDSLGHEIGLEKGRGALGKAAFGSPDAPPPTFNRAGGVSSGSVSDSVARKKSDIDSVLSDDR